MFTRQGIYSTGIRTTRYQVYTVYSERGDTGTGRGTGIYPVSRLHGLYSVIGPPLLTTRRYSDPPRPEAGKEIFLAPIYTTDKYELCPFLAYSVASRPVLRQQ